MEKIEILNEITEAIKNTSDSVSRCKEINDIVYDLEKYLESKKIPDRIASAVCDKIYSDILVMCHYQETYIEKLKEKEHLLKERISEMEKDLLESIERPQMKNCDEELPF